MKFHLRIYDNFRYGDETEACNQGQYDTYAEAVVAAKAIVDACVVENFKTGMNAVELESLYVQYGLDPIIVPNEPGDQESFKAWIMRI